MRSPRRFASHIHVLNREVPFILNIKVLKEGTAHPRLSECSYTIGFSEMNYGQVEAGVGLLTTRTLRDRDVEDETTGTVLVACPGSQ